jgi:type VI secretion system protein VasG
MQVVDLKSLIERLNLECRASLEAAALNCLNRTQYEITPEHLMLRLLDEQYSDIRLIFNQANLDRNEFVRQLEHEIEDLKVGNGGRPHFSPLLAELFADAWLITSVELRDNQIRSGALLAAFISRNNLVGNHKYFSTFRGFSQEKMIEVLRQVARTSIENTGSQSAIEPFIDDQNHEKIPGREAIDRFCDDFTAKAKAGKIDPVFGRDDEIRQIVDILSRRRKNNPICVGDPGVGKTAVIEGLALRIIEGDVPDMLRGATILGLDMGALEAGASIKGEFENRLRNVINELKAFTTPVLLFIDEAHTLIGAGGSAGTNDAANLLKPALARGELRTIAATTWGEYKKYFEKDPALARRFELVKLDEPSVALTVQILRGLKPHYEAMHQVIVREDALVAAAELSHRYITGRQLPDKAIDLFDTACARIKVNLSSKPAIIEDHERSLAMLELEQKGIERDLDNHLPIKNGRLAEISLEKVTIQTELESFRDLFAKEMQAAQQLIKVRQQIAASRLALPIDAGKITKLTGELEQAEIALSQFQKLEKLVHIEVGPDTVAKVVSDRTGIPLGKMMRDQAANALQLDQDLNEHIKGQTAALTLISETLKAARSGLNDPNQPMGIFLLVGPSGVGKTETAISIAELMFGGMQALISINMSEFQEKHSVSRLVGSPPGYVGYGEGGVLSEAVRQRPYAVVLLDEVEKAHLDVVNLFYQVFDKGVLSDGEGREISFRNTVFFLTSNLGLEQITALCAQQSPPKAETLLAAVRPILSQHFKPALLARMTVVPFMTLSEDVLHSIVTLKLVKLAQRLLQNNGITLEFDQRVIEAIARRCTEVETGARNIDYILKGAILPLLSNALLLGMTEDVKPSLVRLEIGPEGEFKATFI